MKSDLLEVCKSIIDKYSNPPEIKKANEWGRTIPVKKMTSDGRMITYWVTPEQMNQGKLKGQQNLFGDDELDQGPESEDSFYSQRDKNTELYQIKPLIEQIKQYCDPALVPKLVDKYTDYMWGRDTKDLDIKLDFETAWFFHQCKINPNDKQAYYEEYLEKTNAMAKQINNRKMAMARLRVGSVVKYKGKKTKIKSISDRGYPIIEVDGKDIKVTVEEIIDLNELIEKYGVEAQKKKEEEKEKKSKGNKDVKKSLTFSGYKLQDRTTFQGMKISIENKKGSYRSGIDTDGHKWKTFMNYAYGYIRGTEGTDGDHVDCYIGPDEDSQKVFIVHQNNPVTHEYDEDKVMLGFNSVADAKKAYMKQYDRPGFFGSIETMDIEQFKDKVFSSKGKKITVRKSFNMQFQKVLDSIGWY